MYDANWFSLLCMQKSEYFLCFGEAYLQGFDSLCWDYAVDNEMDLEYGAAPE